MEIKKFKEKGIERNDIVELTTDYESEFSKSTRPLYFLELQEEELPKPYNEGHPKPPYITIFLHKDKNGCPREARNVRLEDILYLWKLGKSNLVLY